MVVAHLCYTGITRWYRCLLFFVVFFLVCLLLVDFVCFVSFFKPG